MPTNNIETRHRIATEHGGYFRNLQRGLLKISGADRMEWLHNLTTNVIRTLQPGDGNYAFAVTVQGRTVFDLNCLVFEDCVWLDIDNRWLDDAIAHLSKYRVVEDIEIADISANWNRHDIMGRDAARCVDRLHLGSNFSALADVQHTASTVDGRAVHLMKGNMGPIPLAVIYVENPPAEENPVENETEPPFDAHLASVAGDLGMIELDGELSKIIRIEAGHPASVDDIDGDTIPPETLQVERGISYVKGCYLGQEVIERMRSRNSMARRLIGMKISGTVLPPHGAWVFADSKQIGRVTSVCHSTALNSILALGYVKTSLASGGETLRVATSETDFAEAEPVDLPLEVWKSNG
ncbi:MAG: hypothetical protein GXP29_02160 [Planctomycetes bacterium]|nr:hypothetical protein [Planctomycetota bacterium]